jgi:hypothetical protein
MDSVGFLRKVASRMIRMVHPGRRKWAEHRKALVALSERPESEIRERISRFSVAEIRAALADDSWLANYLVNFRELVDGTKVLSSYPWNVSLPIVDFCNASCTFCTSWLRGERWLELEELERFRPVLAHARLLGLAGHGEPLIHPQFDELARLMAGMVDPRCSTYLITNGAHLLRRLDALRTIPVCTYNVSLNAMTPDTHHEVMALGKDTLARILEGIRTLIAIRDREDPRIIVNISLVVVKQNVHEVARFVELGNEMGVNNIYVRTLMPVNGFPAGLNYHSLPPYLHPDFARHREEAQKAIAASRVHVLSSLETWDTPIFPPELEPRILLDPPRYVPRGQARADKEAAHDYKEHNPVATPGDAGGRPRPGPLPESERGPLPNPYNRTTPFHCAFVYQNLILSDFSFRLFPCCYLPREIPGFDFCFYDGTVDFMEVWNCPAMVELRRRLIEGPLFSYCLKCPPKM